MFAHHAWIIIAEALLVLWVRWKPKWALAVWRFLQWAWYYLRRFGLLVRRKLHLPQVIRLGRLRTLNHGTTNGKRFTLRDMFLTSATPYIAKLASVAMVLQWKEYGWRGFLVVWLGGCVRIVAYPFLGKWVFAISGVYLLVRLWQYAKWPIPKWLLNSEEKTAP
jgi:hypothetical protein